MIHLAPLSEQKVHRSQTVERTLQASEMSAGKLLVFSCLLSPSIWFM